MLYVQGRNDGNLLVHSPGVIAGRLGTMSLDPKGWLAMSGERYPITEIGLANLCRQLIKRGESARDPARVEVRRYRNARINARACTLLQLVFPPRAGIRGLSGPRVRRRPVAPSHPRRDYQLPPDGGREPQLVEEYTYLDLKLNNGYGDADFDPKSPLYSFP